jgi:hypothetical protein
MRIDVENPGPNRQTIMVALTSRRDAIERLWFGEAASDEERVRWNCRIRELRREMQELFAKLPEEDWGAEMPF